MKIKTYDDYLEKRKADSLYRTLSCHNPHFIDFASNDYLGLANNPDILHTGYEAAHKYGNGARASRFVTGHCEFFQSVEAKLARFKKRQSAFFGVSGYQMNLSVIPALLNVDLFNKSPLVIFDKSNHASMYQAVKLAGAELIRFKHNDYNHLEDILKKHVSSQRPLFVMTESVYSMDGDLCDLEALSALADKYQALTLVDDAHSTGIMGEGGSGLASAYPEIDIIIGTTSKALGFQGGYVACSEKMMDYFYNSASGMIYSTGVSPFLWGCLDRVLDILPQMDRERHDVQEKAIYLRKKLNDINMTTLSSSTHIVPAICRDNLHALSLEKKLYDNGYITKAIRAPTVPFSLPRLRLTLHPKITYQDIDDLVKIMES